MENGSKFDRMIIGDGLISDGEEVTTHHHPQPNTTNTNYS